MIQNRTCELLPLLPMRTHPAVQRRRDFKHGPHLVLVRPFFRCYLLQGCTQAHTSAHTHTYTKGTTQQCIAFQWHIHQSPTCSPIATLIHPTHYKPTPPLVPQPPLPPTPSLTLTLLPTPTPPRPQPPLSHSYPPAHTLPLPSHSLCTLKWLSGSTSPSGLAL